MANGMGLLTPQESHNHHPQTPAQQVLMSAADRWGLLGLLAMIRTAGSDVDGGLSSVGTDLGTMGLDVGYSGRVLAFVSYCLWLFLTLISRNPYSTFITTWADQSAVNPVKLVH